MLSSVSKVSMTDKCIVLDIDSTLVYTQDDNPDEELPKLQALKIMDPKNIQLRKRIYYLKIDDYKKKGDGNSYPFWGVTRPHLTQFLIFCFSYFKVVAVWSAGSYDYVHKIVEHIFKGIQMPHIILTHDDCDEIDGLIYKPLDRMFSKMNEYMNYKNTFALDDTESTFSRNESNGILIPGYEPNETAISMLVDDICLEQFKYWLLQNEVMNSNDVRKLDKTKIFDTSLENYKKRLNKVINFA